MMEEFIFKVGDEVEAQVIKILNFGAFVKLPNNKKGLVHISQVSDDYVKDINDHLKVGEKVKARIKKISSDGKKIDLTLKKQKKPVVEKQKAREFKNFSLKDKIEKFLKEKP